MILVIPQEQIGPALFEQRTLKSKEGLEAAL